MEKWMDMDRWFGKTIENMKDTFWIISLTNRELTHLGMEKFTKEDF